MPARWQSIGEVAAHAGVTADTIRYFERSGVLPPPDRDSAGRRRYSDDQVHLIDVLLRLRDTGMPLSRIAEFTRWVAADPDGVFERLSMLRQHRDAVTERIRDWERALTVIDQKIEDYERRTTT